MRFLLGLLLAVVVSALLLANPDRGRVSSLAPTPTLETPGQILVAFFSKLDATPTYPDASGATTDPNSATLYAQATIILATVTAQAQGSMPPRTPLPMQQLQATQTAVYATQTAVQAALPQLRLTQ